MEWRKRFKEMDLRWYLDELDNAAQVSRIIFAFLSNCKEEYRITLIDFQ